MLFVVAHVGEFYFACFVQDTARSVGEEIEAASDDDEIVTPGRPTPRVDLTANKGDTTDKAEAKEELPPERRESVSKKKGNTTHNKESNISAPEPKSLNQKTSEQDQRVVTSDDKSEAKGHRPRQFLTNPSEKKTTESKRDDSNADNGESASVTPTKTENLDVSSNLIKRPRSRKDSETSSITSGHGSVKTNFIDDLFKSSTRSRTSYLASFAKEFEVDRAESGTDEAKNSADGREVDRKPSGKDSPKKKSDEKDVKKQSLPHQLSKKADSIAVVMYIERTAWLAASCILKHFHMYMFVFITSLYLEQHLMML